jgi:hypothetical protein
MRGLPATVLTAFMTAIVLFTLTGYQVTSETAATRMLSRLSGSLIEVDRWLDAHHQDIELLARDKPTSTVHIDDLPIGVTLPAAAFIEAASDHEAMRALITGEMGRTLRDEGTGAFQDGQGERRSPAMTEPARWAVTLLGGSMHGFWQAALLLSLLLLLAFAAAVLLAGASPLPSIAMGAGFATAGSLVSWLLATAIGSSMDSAIDREIMLMLRDGAWIGLRNSLAIVVVSGSLLILQVGRPGRRLETAYWPASFPPDSPSR